MGLEAAAAAAAAAATTAAVGVAAAGTATAPFADRDNVVMVKLYFFLTLLF